jgi:hypothetical protein
LAEEINGWAPPLIYDITTFQRRIATQEDIDRLTQVVNILACFRRDVERAMELAKNGIDALNHSVGNG